MEATLYTSASYSQAKSLERERKYDEAILLYESIIEKDTVNIGLFIRLGELYESIHLIDKAVSTYKRGIAFAQKIKNKKAERFLSFTLLGLVD